MKNLSLSLLKAVSVLLRFQEACSPFRVRGGTGRRGSRHELGSFRDSETSTDAGRRGNYTIHLERQFL